MAILSLIVLAISPNSQIDEHSSCKRLQTFKHFTLNQPHTFSVRGFPF